MMFKQRSQFKIKMINLLCLSVTHRGNNSTLQYSIHYQLHDYNYLFSSYYSVKVNEGITNSDLPYSLWTPSYTDSDELLDNKRSLYSIVSVNNGSNSLGNKSLIINKNYSEQRTCWGQPFVLCREVVHSSEDQNVLTL